MERSLCRRSPSEEVSEKFEDHDRSSHLEELAVYAIEGWNDSWIRYVYRIWPGPDYRSVFLMEGMVFGWTFAVKDKDDSPEF